MTAEPRQSLTHDDQIQLKHGDPLVLQPSTDFVPWLVTFVALRYYGSVALVLIEDAGNRSQHLREHLYLPTANDLLTLDEAR